jgi:hypothetical protein
MSGRCRYSSAYYAYATAAAFKRWTPSATAGTMATRAGAITHEPTGDLMTEVIDRLIVTINAHDLDAAAAFFHAHYRSEQPAHPGRAFVGRAQMRANWAAMFAGIPDFHAESAGWYCP